MLKVECLNNSLWNHLDKTIVASIVQRLESDRMRQKRRNTTTAPLASLKGDGKRRGSLFVCFPLFPEGLPLTTEHPPLATCQKGMPASSLIGRMRARQGVVVSILQGIFPIKCCLRMTQTCHPWTLPCCWPKGFCSWSIWKLDRNFRKTGSIQSPFQTTCQLTLVLYILVYFCLWRWSQVNREKKDGMCMWWCGRGVWVDPQGGLMEPVGPKTEV